MNEPTFECQIAAGPGERFAHDALIAYKGTPVKADGRVVGTVTGVEITEDGRSLTLTGTLTEPVSGPVGSVLLADWHGTTLLPEPPAPPVYTILPSSGSCGHDACADEHGHIDECRYDRMDSEEGAWTVRDGALCILGGCVFAVVLVVVLQIWL